MTTDLWRIDATHELGGACTLFRRTRDEAEAEAFKLRGTKWKAAIRPASDLPLNESQANWLCQQYWPMVDTGDVLHFINNAKVQAKEQLREVLHRRDERRATQIKPRSSSRR